MVKTKKYIGDDIITEYTSSNIKSSVYNITEKTLKITFNSGISYQYDNVPHTIVSELNLSESTGNYFNKNISKKYTYKKII